MMPDPAGTVNSTARRAALTAQGHRCDPRPLVGGRWRSYGPTGRHHDERRIDAPTSGPTGPCHHSTVCRRRRRRPGAGVGLDRVHRCRCRPATRRRPSPSPVTPPRCRARPPPSCPSRTKKQQCSRPTRAIGDTWLAANDPPNPDHPGLEKYYTGAARDRAQVSIAEHLALGVRLAFGEVRGIGIDAAVAEIEALTAEVRDCSVDDGLVVAIADGTILNNKVVTNWSVASLVIEDGRWRVSDVVVLERWEGVARCAAE